MNSPWQTLGAWRIFGEARGITYDYQGQLFHVALTPSPAMPDAWRIRIQGEPRQEVRYTAGNNGFMLLQEGARQTRAYALHVGDETQVMLEGRLYRFGRRQPPDVDATARGSSAAQTQKTLTAPMAGTIVKVQAHEGQQVQQRQALVILSAMKMEHTIAAPAGVA